jgi:hypothetical protein
VYEAGETLASAIAWLGVAANVQAGTPYFIALTGDETLSGEWNLNNADLNLTLEGVGETRTINAAGVPAADAVIYLTGSTLTLGNNLTLDGGGRNGRFIEIGGGAALNLTGATLTGNNNNATPGGAVFMSSSGTFTMTGGAITGNSTTMFGGGVFMTSGTFTMTGGVISGNSSEDGGSLGGGGVCISSGPFTMTGGVISGNSSTGAQGGGGVWVGGGYPFTMTGGVITDNTAQKGGGVCISGTVHVDGGTISENTATGGATFGAQVFQNLGSHYIDGEIDPSMTVTPYEMDSTNWDG